MSRSISITLDNEILRFIDERSGDRNRFINDLLLAEKKRVFLKELKTAYQEQENNPEIQILGTSQSCKSTTLSHKEDTRERK